MPRALVVGAGVAGPAAALFLAKAGYDPVVFEAYPGRAKAGAAFAIAPNGMNVLGELGLAEKVAATGTVVDRFDFLTMHGRRLGSMVYGPRGLYRHPGVSLSRTAFYDILLDALEAEGIAVRYGKRLTAIEADEAGVLVRFEDGTADHGDILLGADGLRSAVRRLAFPEAPEPEFTGLIGAGGFVPRSAMLGLVGTARERTMIFSFGDGAFFGCAFGDQREETGAYWWHALAREQPLSAAERRELTGEGGVDALLRAGGGWFPLMRDVVAATSAHIAPLDLFDVAHLPRWHAGRIALLGDVAHAVSPHSGQGASIALEDAITLAKALRSCRGDYRGAFAAYEAERRPRAERIVAMGRRSGNRKRGGRFSGLMRTLLMPLFLRLAPMPRWLYGHDIRWP